jgi:hypothetical protein
VAVAKRASIGTVIAAAPRRRAAGMASRGAASWLVRPSACVLTSPMHVACGAMAGRSSVSVGPRVKVPAIGADSANATAQSSTSGARSVSFS